MQILGAERAVEFKELAIVTGVHCFFFLLGDSDVSETGTIQFKDETVHIDKTDEELLGILGAVLAKNADRGIIDVYVFFYGDKAGILPLFTKIAERALDQISEIIQNYREFGVQKSKTEPKKVQNRKKSFENKRRKDGDKEI